MLFYGYSVFQLNVIKHVTATLQIKSCIRISQSSFFHEQRNILCKKEHRMNLLLGNHCSQKVQFSIPCIVKFFSEFKFKTG